MTNQNVYFTEEEDIEIEKLSKELKISKIDVIRRCFVEGLEKIKKGDK